MNTSREFAVLGNGNALPWKDVPETDADVFVAASALSLTALNDNPGGSISPFCEPATVTSTPHSSWR